MRPKTARFVDAALSHGSTTVLGAHGFPELSVPVGFTTQVFDRVPQSITDTVGVLTGPVPAVLPVGIEMQGLPFTEPLLLYVASVYQEANPQSRQPPPEFPPLSNEP